jgi:tRNA-dihydrouridine synthase
MGSDRLAQLKNGVALAELGGYGDGPYCAKHGAGAALVVMGTYIVDASDRVPYPAGFVFKPGRENYAGYLRQHIAEARRSGAAVGVSVVSVRLEDSIDFLAAAEEAGADYVSLCLHSVMEMFVSRGLSSALLWRENWPRLREQVGACLAALRGPFIAKVGLSRMPDAEQAVGELVSAGVPIVHANVGTAASARGEEVIRQLRKHGAFLMVSGGISKVEQARRALAAGADAVAVGTAAMENPGLCGQLQTALRQVSRG